jgi:hypothetical protein
MFGFHYAAKVPPQTASQRTRKKARGNSGLAAKFQATFREE